MKGKINKKIILIFGILVVISGVLIHNSQTPKVDVKEIRIASNNMQNGVFATDGEWIYYTNRANEGDDDSYDLRRVKVNDVTENQLLIKGMSERPEGLSYIGDHLYVHKAGSLYCVDENLSELRKLQGDSEGCNSLTDGTYIYGNYSYTNKEYGVVFSNNKAGVQSENKMDGYPTKLFLQGDFLYAMSSLDKLNEEKNPYKGTWRYDVKKLQQTRILDYCPDYFVVLEDEIYYTDENRRLCSMNLDGTENVVYEGIYVDLGLNATEDYIFYIDRETGAIHRMNRDGTENIRLNSDDSSEIKIIDGWIEYANHTKGGHYKMSFDGTENIPVEKKVLE